MSLTTLRNSLLAQIEEEAELAAALLGMIPAEHEEWRPPWPATAEGDPPFSMNQLALHLTDAMSGFCAVLEALHGGRLRHAEQSRGGTDLAGIRRGIAEGFAITVDADLARTLPSVFEARGQPALELFLVNLRHVTAHKFQLYLYLKILGLPVSSRHLYRFRG